MLISNTDQARREDKHFFRRNVALRLSEDGASRHGNQQTGCIPPLLSSRLARDRIGQVDKERSNLGGLPRCWWLKPVDRAAGFPYCRRAEQTYPSGLGPGPFHCGSTGSMPRHSAIAKTRGREVNNQVRPSDSCSPTPSSTQNGPEGTTGGGGRPPGKLDRRQLMAAVWHGFQSKGDQRQRRHRDVRFRTGPADRGTAAGLQRGRV